MGKGYNNYMCKKPFHPGSKANIKRAWMAEQKTESEKRKQEDLKVQYEKEQELYNNRALLSTESKDKLELNFMYEAPPGAKRERQKEDDEPEFKFEWQRKYNAPREDYAKGNADIKDQPFGIPVRNVRCIKCHKWGHINTDKECPLYAQASTSSMPTTSMDPMELMRQMREDGFGLKESVLGHQLNPQAANQQLLPSDESDPEMEFLKSLSASEKKKLLRKLKKLSKKQERATNCKKKKSKKSGKSKIKDKSTDRIKKKRKKPKESESSDESSSSTEDSSEGGKEVKQSKKHSGKKYRKRDISESDESESDSDEPKKSKRIRQKKSSFPGNEKSGKIHSRKSDTQKTSDGPSESSSESNAFKQASSSNIKRKSSKISDKPVVNVSSESECESERTLKHSRSRDANKRLEHVRASKQSVTNDSYTESSFFDGSCKRSQQSSSETNKNKAMSPKKDCLGKSKYKTRDCGEMRYLKKDYSARHKNNSVDLERKWDGKKSKNKTSETEDYSNSSKKDRERQKSDKRWDDQKTNKHDRHAHSESSKEKDKEQRLRKKEFEQSSSSKKRIEDSDSNGNFHDLKLLELKKQRKGNESDDLKSRKFDEQKLSESKKHKWESDSDDDLKSKEKYQQQKLSESKKREEENHSDDGLKSKTICKPSDFKKHSKSSNSIDGIKSKSEQTESEHSESEKKEDSVDFDGGKSQSKVEKKGEQSECDDINSQICINVECDSSVHPDGFSHVCPQARIETNYLQAEKEYQGDGDDKFRHFHRKRRSPSIKHKYNK